MFEEIVALFNSHPLLWVICGVAFTLPVVALVTYFWPKVSTLRRAVAPLIKNEGLRDYWGTLAVIKGLQSAIEFR